MTRPLLAVTLGDPCGIGPEVVLKAAASERAVASARLLVVGDERLLRRTARELKVRWPFSSVVTQPPVGRRWEKPQLLDLANVDESVIPGQISAQAGRAAGEYIETATRLVLEGVVDGVVTAPVHKQALSLAGYQDSGHTELLARLSGLGEESVGMLFFSDKLSVGLLTTHLPIRDALKKVRANRIVRMLRLFDREWRRFLGGQPRIAVAALNPHAGEGGRFGVEESRYVAPAVERARLEELLVWGPVPADSVFVRALAGEFDLVLALYHDQATIPIKLLSGRESVNVTVGLPFVRTSVDHGTAMDIAGKGVAEEASMVAAIRVAARFSCRVAETRAVEGPKQ
jgi:4-hydroxythreonine-4-phosphate dehydrogenase